MKLSVLALVAVLLLAAPTVASAQTSSPTASTITRQQIAAARKYVCSKLPSLSICRPGAVDTALITQYINLTCAQYSTLPFCRPSGGGGNGGGGNGGGGNGGGAGGNGGGAGGSHPGTGLTLWPLGLGGLLCLGSSYALLRCRSLFVDAA